MNWPGRRWEGDDSNEDWGKPPTHSIVEDNKKGTMAQSAQDEIVFSDPDAIMLTGDPLPDEGQSFSRQKRMAEKSKQSEVKRVGSEKKWMC